MGPGWFMHKERFWELGGMDEGHGGWGQMGVEVACKAWLSGGALKVDKNTWFAHWFRGGGGSGFPYEISGRAVEKAREYSRDIWLNDKWDKQKRKFDWMIKKFNPPGWTDIEDEVKYYRHFTSKEHKFPKWMGVDVIKYPNDLITYQEIMFENKPDVLIETGTHKGGSALFFASVFDAIGKGQVITIDKYDNEPPKHPRITYIVDRTTEKRTLDKVKQMVKGKTVMASLDSNHHRSHVKRELVRYGAIVTKGQYMVVEDTCYNRQGKKSDPAKAVEWFLARTKNFKVMPLEKKYKYSLARGGWLKKK
jgi:cephalosporin hydroxylase